MRQTFFWLPWYISTNNSLDGHQRLIQRPTRHTTTTLELESHVGIRRPCLAQHQYNNRRFCLGHPQGDHLMGWIQAWVQAVAAVVGMVTLGTAVAVLRMEVVMAHQAMLMLEDSMVVGTDSMVAEVLEREAGVVEWRAHSWTSPTFLSMTWASFRRRLSSGANLTTSRQQGTAQVRTHIIVWFGIFAHHFWPARPSLTYDWQILSCALRTRPFLLLWCSASSKQVSRCPPLFRLNPGLQRFKTGMLLVSQRQDLARPSDFSSQVPECLDQTMLQTNDPQRSQAHVHAASAQAFIFASKLRMQDRTDYYGILHFMLVVSIREMKFW
jgi:hypothetical protein